MRLRVAYLQRTSPSPSTWWNASCEPSMASASAGISSTSVTNLIQYRHFTASAVSKLASIYRTRTQTTHNQILATTGVGHVCHYSLRHSEQTDREGLNGYR